MKQYSYPLIILLCITHLNHAFELPHATQAVVGTGVLVLVTGLLSYKMGESSEKNSKEAELKHKQLEHEAEEKHKRLERETKENAEQKRQSKFTQRFHQIERMQQTAKIFEHFIRQPNTEPWNDEQQKNFAQEIMANSGSIGAFEKQLNRHIESYETFDPETALKHKDLHGMMLLLKRAIHTNHYITNQKRCEEEEAFKKRERQAYLKKAENEALAAQGLVTAIAQVKEMASTIKDTTHRSQQQFINEVCTLKSTLNRGLTELNDWQSRRASEHEKSIKEQKKIQDALGKLNKKTDQTQKDITSIKEEIKQERSNKGATPSVPPQSANPPTYSPEYVPSYSPPSSNPPAYNPDYRPQAAT